MVGGLTRLGEGWSLVGGGEVGVYCAASVQEGAGFVIEYFFYVLFVDYRKFCICVISDKGREIRYGYNVVV